jgi:hypothetical protein
VKVPLIPPDHRPVGHVFTILPHAGEGRIAAVENRRAQSTFADGDASCWDWATRLGFTLSVLLWLFAEMGHAFAGGLRSLSGRRVFRKWPGWPCKPAGTRC